VALEEEEEEEEVRTTSAVETSTRPGMNPLTSLPELAVAPAVDHPARD
jgi:hypothetical protein